MINIKKLMNTYILLSTCIVCYSNTQSTVKITEVKLATTKQFKGPYEQGTIEFMNEYVRPKIPKEKKEVLKKRYENLFFHPVKENGIYYSNSRSKEKIYSGKWCKSGSELTEISKAKKKGDFCIEKNGKKYFQFSATWTITDKEVKSFYVADNQFVIETENQIYIDKKDINKHMAATETFFPRHFNDKPFFLATKNGKSYVVYDFEIQGNGYDLIFHYGCCEPSIMNPKTKENGITFFAKKDGYWMFVTVEIKKVN